MTSSAPTHGVVLFAHGSRDPLWHKPIEAVASHMASLSPSTPVVCAYLELSQPDLNTGVAQLMRQGVQSVTIVPMFLGVGKHAREDLPVLVTTLKEQHPQVQFQLQSAVGEDTRLVHLLAEIALSTP